MTPPEIVCPVAPPPPPSLTQSTTTTAHHANGFANGAERTNLLQDIRNGTMLKKTPKLENENSIHTTNGVVSNENSSEPAPAKPIKSMDRVQVELNEHFRAKENGTLKKKPPAVQPIVKRLLTEKPSSESAQKENNSERLMLNHGKRNFVIKKSTTNSNGTPSASSSSSREETPEPEVEKQEVIAPVVTKSPPVEKLPPLKIPSRDLPERPMSPAAAADISKIIKSPPMSPLPTKLKINHGKPNYTLPRRLKSTTDDDPKRTPLEFMTMKLRQTPNSPLLQEAPFEESPPKSAATPALPFRSVTLGCKKENPPPCPMVPAAPTYDAPKFDQKIVVSFAMDLAATPNRYPDQVKVTSQRPPAANVVPKEVLELREKKFTIDPNRLSVSEQ